MGSRYWHYRKQIVFKIIRKFFPENISSICITNKIYSAKRMQIRVLPMEKIEGYHFSERDLLSLRETYSRAMNHEFCILSDKWFCVNKDDGKSRSEYVSMDWHRDFKSNFVFNSNIHYSKLPSKYDIGTDIKFPWEFARLQHLPQIALFSFIEPNVQKLVKKEFINEITDFVEHNKICYGIHWASPMEVAIRSSNIILAYSIISTKCSFSAKENDMIISLLRGGYYYILYNLEVDIKNGKNGNHYLADLCGLLFITWFLDCDETKKQLPFIVGEINSEIQNQFFEDGGGYEFSSTYTRLSAEMSSYCIALMNRLGCKINPIALSRLKNVAFFLESIILKNGDIIQIGDNDSGVFFNLIPVMQNCEKNSNSFDMLASQNGLSAIAGLFGRERDIHSCFVSSINGTQNLDVSDNNKRCSIISDFPTFECLFQKETIIKEQIDYFSDGPLLFPQFGLAIYGGENKLFIRFPVDLSVGKSAHAHNDFFHFELSNDKYNSFSDQGSGFYSPFPGIRNYFRSSKAHNVPSFHREINSFNGLWGMNIESSGGVSFLSQNEISMWMKFDDVVCIREIKIQGDEIHICDKSNSEFHYKCSFPSLRSNGYGCLYKDNKPLSFYEIFELNNYLSEEKV